jgi:hypothetical protein
MLPSILIAAIVIWGAVTIYFAARSRDFRKFLAGAFFASAGIQLYLSVVGVSVPLIGTSFVQTPELSAIRSSIHFVLLRLHLEIEVVWRPCAYMFRSRPASYSTRAPALGPAHSHPSDSGAASWAYTSKGRVQSQDSKFVAGCLTCRLQWRIEPRQYIWQKAGSNRDGLAT